MEKGGEAKEQNQHKCISQNSVSAQVRNSRNKLGVRFQYGGTAMRVDNGVQEGEELNRTPKKNKIGNNKREQRNHLGQDRLERVLQRPGVEQGKSVVSVRE